MVIGLFPLLLATQFLHWLTFLLDEILIRGYRNVQVREPLFALGEPAQRLGSSAGRRFLASADAIRRTAGCVSRRNRTGSAALRLNRGSLLISGNVAEHLALSRSQARSLIDRCFAWFEDNDLPRPALYMPPAWAMGPIGKDDLDRLPFSRYETLMGVYSARARTFRRMPMTGFEADTAFRALSCRAWNFINLPATGTSRPVRVAIHPRDLELLLAADMRRFLDDGGRALSYRDIDFLQLAGGHRGNRTGNWR